MTNRALSLDGKSWEIQYLLEAPGSFWGRKGDTTITCRYARIASLSNVSDWPSSIQANPEPQLRLYPQASRIDWQSFQSEYEKLLEIILNIKVPLTIQDHFEYWLLDEDEKKPLALISSCCSTDECTQNSHSLLWSVLPDSKLNLQNNTHEQKSGLPPVTYRLEQLVKKRSGQYPQATWYQRQLNGDGILMQESNETNQILKHQDFPAFLLRDDWKSPQAQALCDRYLHQLSPRLLMLQNLSFSQRDRAERRANALTMW